MSQTHINDQTIYQALMVLGKPQEVCVEYHQQKVAMTKNKEE